MGFNIDVSISAVSVEGAMSGASVSFADYAHNSTSSDHSRPPHLFSFANSEDCTDSDRPLSSFVSARVRGERDRYKIEEEDSGRRVAAMFGNGLSKA